MQCRFHVKLKELLGIHEITLEIHVTYLADFIEKLSLCVFFDPKLYSRSRYAVRPRRSSIAYSTACCFYTRSAVRKDKRMTTGTGMATLAPHDDATPWLNHCSRGPLACYTPRDYPPTPHPKLTTNPFQFKGYNQVCNIQLYSLGTL